MLTVVQVLELAGRMADRRFRALVLLTVASLRWGEAIALTREDADLEARTVSVRRQYVELTGRLDIAELVEMSQEDARDFSASGERPIRSSAGTHETSESRKTNESCSS